MGGRLDQPGDPPPLAEMVAPLVAAALVAADLTDPADLNALVRYRIHPGIAEAVHAATSEPVTAAVDAQLAAWWTGFAVWGIEQERAGQDTSQLVVLAGLAAAPYLLRCHDWNTAGLLLEQARMRDTCSPVTAQAVIPSLRRIAEATGEAKNLGVLAAVLRQVDPLEAETLLRRVYDQASISADHQLASGIAGELVFLLRDQGRLHEALDVADKMIEQICQAGQGSWTQMCGQAWRLNVLSRLGHHEQVLTALPALRNRMAELPDQSADNDTANPWNVRELVLNTGGFSAISLKRWQQALNITNEMIDLHRRRGASAHDTARARFNNVHPLVELGHQVEAEQVLHDCQEVAETVGDIAMLANVFIVRANLEYQRGHLQDALMLQRTALRLTYVGSEPRDVAISPYKLANFLVRATGTSAEQRAHRLAAVVLNHFTGDIHERAQTLRALADELRSDAARPDAPALPTTLPEVIRLVDAGDGVHFGDLVASLCPDPDTANRALADLLATAATLPPENTVESLLTDWDPIIIAIVTAATTGHTPTELADTLTQLDNTTHWAALGAALRRVLAGERDHEHLLTGLDEVETVILTATLDRLPTDPEQHP